MRHLVRTAGVSGGGPEGLANGPLRMSGRFSWVLAFGTEKGWADYEGAMRSQVPAKSHCRRGRGVGQRGNVMGDGG